MDEKNTLSLSPEKQIDLWNSMRLSIKAEEMENPFAKDPRTEEQRRKLAKHKLWLESFQHECPSPYVKYRTNKHRLTPCQQPR